MEEIIKNNTESIEQKSEKRWNRYNYALLDPRNIPAAAESNAKIFATGDIYGIEVTVPALAEQCVENIDPQHTDGNANSCAIERAALRTNWTKLPEEGSTLATIRADLDSIGAMAVLSDKLDFESTKNTWDYDTKNKWDIEFNDPRNDEGILGDLDENEYYEVADWTSIYYSVRGLGSFLRRVDKIAESDKFAHGGYPGPKPLPSVENPWSDGTSELSAIAAAVADFKTPLADRVAMMGTWLTTGEEPAKYREQVEKERLDLVNALEYGKICYDVIADKDGGCDVAVIETSHRAATTVGYALAPVVIAYNPEFKQGPGEAYKKYTICQFEDKFVDIKAVREELNELEPGWGGSPTIIGSPQGVSSKLKIEEVAVIVEKHLVR